VLVVAAAVETEVVGRVSTSAAATLLAVDVVRDVVDVVLDDVD
jgi:hypothetical protein